MQKSSLKKNKVMDKFLTWLNKNGASFPNIYFKTYKNHERGVHTKVAIPEHQTVVKIPRSILIYSGMGEKSPWGKKVSQYPTGISGLNLVYICLYIIQDMEYKNKFGPYYKILPKKFDNFPIFWSPADKKYLENSYLLKEIDIRKDILVKDYHKLCQILHDFSSICSLQKFLQIRNLVGSRNFGLWIDGKKQATMVPLGDMLNHSATPDVKWFFEEETNAFVMNSIQSIIPHSAISDSYGTKCNRSYILFYGFVLSDDTKCRNTIFIQINQPISTIKIQGLRYQLISNEFSRNISSDFNSLNFRQMMTFLRISNANETELAAFIQNRQLSQNPYSKRNEAAALSYLAYKINKLLNTYSLSFSQNKANLKKFTPYSNKSFATILVMGEKIIMKELLAFIKLALGILLLNNRVSTRQLKNNVRGYILTLRTIH
uniref:SET domain-containing protein n=1 Tax=viral metagenome TaxID=1070528 RepID=A0A6C0ENW9_9ZZZZ